MCLFVRWMSTVRWSPQHSGTTGAAAATSNQCRNALETRSGDTLSRGVETAVLKQMVLFPRVPWATWAPQEYKDRRGPAD